MANLRCEPTPYSMPLCIYPILHHHHYDCCHSHQHHHHLRYLTSGPEAGRGLPERVNQPHPLLTEQGIPGIITKLTNDDGDYCDSVVRPNDCYNADLISYFLEYVIPPPLLLRHRKIGSDCSNDDGEDLVIGMLSIL